MEVVCVKGGSHYVLMRLKEWRVLYCMSRVVYLYKSVKHLGVRLLDHMAPYFLVFCGTSIVTAPIYIPTNNIGRFPFLHTLSSIYL